MASNTQAVAHRRAGCLRCVFKVWAREALWPSRASLPSRGVRGVRAGCAHRWSARACGANAGFLCGPGQQRDFVSGTRHARRLCWQRGVRAGCTHTARPAGGRVEKAWFARTTNQLRSVPLVAGRAHA